MRVHALIDSIGMTEVASSPDTYAARDYLRPYLPFLPEVMRLPKDPEEEWW